MSSPAPVLVIDFDFKMSNETMASRSGALETSGSHTIPLVLVKDSTKVTDYYRCLLKGTQEMKSTMGQSLTEWRDRIGDAEKTKEVDDLTLEEDEGAE
jgi:hypothetical protein